MVRLSVAAAVTATMVIIAIMVMTALPAGPVVADRHCAPAVDFYYRARYEIRAALAACPAGLSRAADQLEEAAIAARNCGCGAMQAGLQALLDRIGSESGDDDRSCEARSALVFEFAGQVDDAYDACP